MNRTRLAVLAIPALLAGCSAPAGPVKVDYMGAVNSAGAATYTDADGKLVTETLADGGGWAQSITAQPGTTVTLVLGDARKAGAWCSILVNGKTVADRTAREMATCSYTVPK